MRSLLLVEFFLEDQGLILWTGECGSEKGRSLRGRLVRVSLAQTRAEESRFGKKACSVQTELRCELLPSRLNQGQNQTL